MDFSNFHNFIAKLKIKETIYYIKLLWKPNDNDLFQITIFNDEKTWSGKFSNSCAEKYREHLEKSFEEYCSEINMCLEEQTSDYICELLISHETDSATFKWSKVYEDVKVIYGSVPLMLANESKDDLIDYLISENKKLDSTIKLSIQRNEKLNTDLEKYKLELINLTNLKTSLESDLYSRFLELLNAKKRRIILLEEKLQNATLS